MTKTLGDRVRNAAQHLDTPIAELSPEDGQAYRNYLSEKFLYGEIENLKHFVGDRHVLSRDSWQWIESFIRQTPDVVLFFQETDDPTFFAVGDSTAVIRLLQHSGTCGAPNYEFYLTNNPCDFLLRFDNEYALYTIGTASDWLNHMLAEVYDMMGVSPNSLRVTDVQTIKYGTELVLDCAYDLQQRLPLRLIFKGCSAIEWQIFEAKPRDATMQHIYLGRERHSHGVKLHKPKASIRTDQFEIKLTYNDLYIEKRW